MLIGYACIDTDRITEYAKEHPHWTGDHWQDYFYFHLRKDRAAISETRKIHEHMTYKSGILHTPQLKNVRHNWQRRTNGTIYSQGQIARILRKADIYIIGTKKQEEPESENSNNQSKKRRRT